MIHAEELMIGDLVKWKVQKGFTEEDRNMVLRVTQICNGKIWIEGRCGPYVESLFEPIPLTPEILERNGFVTKDKGREHYGYLMYFLYDEEDHCLLGVKWYIKDSIAEIILETTPYYIIIKYVHQLQHVLRLCGLRKEIKMEG